MGKRILAIVLILISVGLVIYWVVDGALIYSVEQVQVTTTDPLFGTPVTEWKDESHLGLLPYVAPIAGSLVVIALWLFWSAGRPRKAPML